MKKTFIAIAVLFPFLTGTLYADYPSSCKTSEIAYHEIVSKNSGKCLDIAGHNRDSNANLQQYSCHGQNNQLFRIRNMGYEGNTVAYRVIPIHSGICLDVAGSSKKNNANIQQYPCHGGDNQLWKFVKSGGDYYNLVSVHSGMCLDVAGSSKKNNANIQQYRCHNGNNQKWKISNTICVEAIP